MPYQQNEVHQCCKVPEIYTGSLHMPPRKFIEVLFVAALCSLPYLLFDYLVVVQSLIYLT